MSKNRMRVIEMETAGGPEVLVEQERAVPVPRENEVLIQVVAAGVNGPDLVQRRGHYPPPKGASDLLGLEVSGQIVACGSKVTRWSVGDKVCALTNGGGYAEFVAVIDNHCLPVPDGVPLEDAAGLPETYFTVWSNIFFKAHISQGPNFLIQGGAGGIGSTAVQLGKVKGLTVFATADGPDDCLYCESIGADRAIDFRTEDFVSILRDAGGADIVLDIIGGDYVSKHIKACRHDARIVSIAFNAGSKVNIDLMPMMLKRLTLTGSTLRSRPDDFKSGVARDLEDQVWPEFGSGSLKVVTQEKMPLSKASNAHKAMEAASHKGKLLLIP